MDVPVVPTSTASGFPSPSTSPSATPVERPDPATATGARNPPAPSLNRICDGPCVELKYRSGPNCPSSCAISTLRLRSPVEVIHVRGAPRPPPAVPGTSNRATSTSSAAITASRIPSPVTSATSISYGIVGHSTDAAATNPAAPLPTCTVRVESPAAPTSRSSLPSPVQSTTASAIGWSCTGTSMRGWNVRSPLPRKIETRPAPWMVTTMSRWPSPLTSPRATLRGAAPVLRSVRGPKTWAEAVDAVDARAENARSAATADWTTMPGRGPRPGARCMDIASLSLVRRTGGPGSPGKRSGRRPGTVESCKALGGRAGGRGVRQRGYRGVQTRVKLSGGKARGHSISAVASAGAASLRTVPPCGGLHRRVLPPTNF